MPITIDAMKALAGFDGAPDSIGEMYWKVEREAEHMEEVILRDMRRSALDSIIKTPLLLWVQSERRRLQRMRDKRAKEAFDYVTGGEWDRAMSRCHGKAKI
jgi:hypothetical protein